jgi:hypothetical protein
VHRIDRSFLWFRHGDANMPCSPPPATTSAASSADSDFCCAKSSSLSLRRFNPFQSEIGVLHGRLINTRLEVDALRVRGLLRTSRGWNFVMDRE